MLLWGHEASQLGTGGGKGFVGFFFSPRGKGKKSAKPRFDLTEKCNWPEKCRLRRPSFVITPSQGTSLTTPLPAQGPL